MPVEAARFALPDGGVLHYVELGPGHWGLSQAPQYRVYVIPGSGCQGLGGIALDYFQGLSHGEVIIPHKRHVDAFRWSVGPIPCSPAFVRDDNLHQWAQDVAAFIRWHLQHRPLAKENQPMALVGISEGAELLAVIAAELPQVKLLALLGSSGLDPLEALSLHAQTKGSNLFVRELLRRTDNSAVADDHIWSGRSMAYWRSLVAWRHSDALLASPHPLFLGFGTQDEVVPLVGLRRFESRAQAQNRPLCMAVFEGADHSLRMDGLDRPLQHYWAVVSDALSRNNPLRACPQWAGR